MSPLRRKTSEPPAVSEVLEPETVATGKGKVTPKRTDARAARARQRKGKPQSRKEMSARRREIMAETRASMKGTDVSKLPKNERVPELVYTRDLVDSRFFPGQIMVWVMLLVLVVGQIQIRAVIVFSEVVGLGSIVAIGVSTYLSCARIQREVNDRYPDTPAKVKGYAFRRIVAPRRMRRPVARLHRGDPVR